MSKTVKATKTTEAAATPTAPKRNAAQTIAALENAFMSQNQQIQMLADELNRVRNIITSLNKRVNASIQAAEEGSLNGDSVNKIILNENMKELEGKVTFLVEQGVLTKNDDKEISEQTFVVGREIDAEGNVVNPRVQFAVGSIEKTIQEKLLSKKIGAMIQFGDTDPKLEITEVYEINQPAVKKDYEAQPVVQ